MPEQLRTQRDLFLNPDNSIFTWKGHIDFMCFERSLVDGESINEGLKVAYDLGSRIVVTLMMANYIKHFYPNDYGWRYFGHIKPFAKAVNDLGFYWNPIVFADAKIIMPGVGDQQAFLSQIANEFNGEPNVIVSLGNELQKNGIDPSNFNRPATSNLWSRGSNVGDTAPFTPGWDYKEWHPRRDWPKVLWGNDDMWYVKEGITGSGQILDQPKPGICGEPIGFWSQDVFNRRSSDPNLARVIGGTSVYNGNGGNFMSEEGLKFSPVSWSDRTKQCAVAFYEGLNQGVKA